MLKYLACIIIIVMFASEIKNNNYNNLAMLTAKINNRPTEQPKATEYRPQLLTVPANYYGVRGMYYGD